jgi:hypothetical protein
MGERSPVGREQGDVGPEIRGEPLQRGLLLGRGRLRGRQHVLGEHARDLEGISARAAVASQAPEEAGDQSERHQAREDRHVDAEVEPAHQSCRRAKT